MFVSEMTYSFEEQGVWLWNIAEKWKEFNLKLKTSKFVGLEGPDCNRTKIKASSFSFFSSSCTMWDFRDGGCFTV